jgi:peptide methionine sulfoxide reductase MsrA
VAEKVKAEKQKDFGKPIVTEITRATAFFPAEEYHQKFTEKTGQGMCHVEYQPIR